MKKLLLLLATICALLSQSCAQTPSSNTIEDGKDKMKKTYFASYDVKGHFEIVFNGISLTKNKEEGVINGLEYLNPYISKSGEQTITLILKSVSKKISPKEVKNYFIDIVYTDSREASPINKVIKCSFPETEIPVDSLTYSWTFEADVPFEINTLDNALDLTKEDPQKLFEEVVNQYKYVYGLINKGRVDEYMKLYENSRKREMISMYYDENQQKEYLNQIKEFIYNGKNNMLPFVDYKINISPNKKIIELEDSKGNNTLKSNDGENINTYGLQLYKSKITGKLEVY